MKDFNSFTNCYSIKKTLRFALIPIGETEEKIKENEQKLIVKDKTDADNGKIAKICIDVFHKAYIDSILNDTGKTGGIQESVREFDKIYSNPESDQKNDDDKYEKEKEKNKILSKLRKEISDLLNKDKDAINAFFNKKLLEKLQDFIRDEKNEELFKNAEQKLNKSLTTEDRLSAVKYFTAGNNQKSNFAYFKDFNICRKNMYSSESKPTSIAHRCANVNLKIFIDNIQKYNKIPKDEINKFNDAISPLCDKFCNIFNIDYYHYVLSQSGIEKYNEIIGVINQCVNLYNQNHKKNEKLDFLQRLQKQILSDKFIGYEFETDEEMLAAIKEINDNLFSDNSSFIERAKRLSDNNEIKNKIEAVTLYRKEFNKTYKDYDFNKRIQYQDKAISSINNYLTSIKSLERAIKKLSGDSEEINSLLEELSDIDGVYNGVRNYITRRLDAQNKLRLSFNSATFLDGWDTNKEKGNLGVILRKYNEKRDDYDYYLGIMTEKNKDVFKKAIPACNNGDTCYQKMIYKQIPSPDKYLSKSKIKNIPDNIQKILDKEIIVKNSKDITLTNEEVRVLIDFYKKFLDDYELLKDPSGNHYFNFKFKNSDEYKDKREFFNDIKQQAYSISFIDFSEEYINSLINDGKLYLFKIYNKDFSPYSKGTPNMHTLYFRMLFDEANLKNPVYKLNGGARMFFRDRQVSYSDEIMEKGHHSEELEGKFGYPIIKDKRFTERQYSIHIPITLNNNPNTKVNLNKAINDAFHGNDNNYVIGVDCGERNLLYICVVDSNGKIAEQYSLNEIINEHNGKKYSKDFHSLLIEKEEQRLGERRGWASLSSMKHLKDAYLGQAIHKICELALKYHAIIALEDLDTKFIRNRMSHEIQIYQKIDERLINKLSYYVCKKQEINEAGGLLKAYQLCNSESDKDYYKQNGIIYKVDPWLTSKLDPTTGFVNLLWKDTDMNKESAMSKKEAQEFIGCFEDISYNDKEDMFEFKTGTKKFPDVRFSYQRSQTICSNGTRTQRNKVNNKKTYEEINLTDTFKELFSTHDIDLNSSIKEQIINKGLDSKDFIREFFNLLKLTVTMRNIDVQTETEYFISPVKNSEGDFYDSRKYINTTKLPDCPDAIGAYNIARKAHMLINDNKKYKREKWLEYAQKNTCKAN